MRNNLLATARGHWRVIGLVGSAFAIVAFLLLYRLGSLTHGLSGGELDAQTTNSLRAIWNNPLYLPVKLVRLIIAAIVPHPGQFLLRLPSVIFGGLALYGFARILRHWYGFKAMLYGTALFGTSSWFLHASRLATFDSLYLCIIPAIILTTLALRQADKDTWGYYLSPLIFGLIVYIPGALWVVLLAAAWYWRDYLEAWQHHSDIKERLIWLGLWVISLALLIVSLIRSPELIKAWFGFPHNFDSAWMVIQNFAAVFKHIFVKGAHQPELWLGNLPVLSVFGAIMFIVGVYFYARHWQAPRSRQLLAFIILSALVIALGGPVSLSLIVPTIYLVVVAGIGYLLREWFKVFPRNPLARGIGVVVIALTIGLACWYNLRQYFVAWPHSAHTRSVFHERVQN